jgi:LmbE family N-acetylglucosaminyl deacetylase
MDAITSENEWLEYFSSLNSWQPSLKPTIVLTPHPDDETLCAGGIITDLHLKEVDVTVIAITDGENAYKDVSNLRNIRSLEQDHALATLGIKKEKIHRLKYEDSNVASDEDKLEKTLLSYINCPMNIFAPWKFDFHPDHEAVGRVAEKIAAITESTLIFYFFWTWHRGTVDTVKQLPLRLYQLSPQTLETKLKAINYYQSQLVHYNNEPILPEKFLLPTKRTFEVFLPL